MRRSVVLLSLCCVAGAARADLMRWDDEAGWRPRIAVDATTLRIELPQGWPPERYLVRLALGPQGDGGILVSPRAPVVLDGPDDVVPVTLTVLGTDGREVSFPYRASVVFGSCGDRGVWAYPAATAVAQRAPTWVRAPESDGLQLLETGDSYLRFRARAPVNEALVRVRLLAPDGRLLYHCVDDAGLYGGRQANQLLHELPKIAWPELVRLELTLVDGAGRSSDTRVLDVPVVRHGGATPGRLAERLLLFVVLPFLVGYLAGGRLARARRHLT